MCRFKNSELIPGDVQQALLKAYEEAANEEIIYPFFVCSEFVSSSLFCCIPL